MKRAIRGASGIAILAGLASFGTAFAQQGPIVQTTTQDAQSSASQGVDQTSQAQGEQPEGERVVVIGSLVATTPEDAPRPVEVFTAEDLENQGSPSISEFVRSLSVVAPSGAGFGQANPEVLGGAGFANVDLRGQGSSGTLVLFNGRRLATTNGGFGADVNTLPAEALEAVEVLKDGASATYGAGAVGGVINFRTRRDIDAPQISIEKSFYDGNDGAYKVDFLTGWVGDSSNLLVSLSHEGEDSLRQTERDFSSLSPDINPAAYTATATNPGRFHPTFAGFGPFSIGATNFYTSTGYTVLGGVNDYPGGTASSLGAVTADGRAACESIGGFLADEIVTATTATGCAFPEFAFNDLVQEYVQDRAYVEYNSDLTDTMEFTVNALYSKRETRAHNFPTQGGPNDRVIDPSANTGVCVNFLTCYYVIPRRVQTYDADGNPTGVFTTNDHVEDFLTRTGAAIGPTGALLTSPAWRPFMFGGNPAFDDGRTPRTGQRERFQVNAGFKGEFDSDGLLSFLNGIEYDYAGQFNQYTQTNVSPDIIKSRLHNALLGYGGPECNAVDRVATDFSSAADYNRTIGIQSDTAPGTNGCQFFNPFATAWATSIVNGAANPQYVPGSENSLDLINWMIEPRHLELQLQSATFDALWTGSIPDDMFTLPGGQIGWAAGLQWRQVESRNTAYSDTETGEIFLRGQCFTPDPDVERTNAGGVPQVGGRGCPEESSAFFSQGRAAQEFSDSQTFAQFFELQLPITERLNMVANARRESFNGGDIVGEIWSLAGKYDITDNLYVRASYGTNFRADDALDADPGFTTFTTTSNATSETIFGEDFQYVVRNTVAQDIGPEDDTTLNIGVGYDNYFGDHRIRASIDFYEIVINDAVVTTTSADVLNNVFTTPTGDPTALADCSARLIDFVNLGSGTCVQGVTSGADIQSIQTFETNGPGFISNGVDYSFDYSYPILDGIFSFNLTATNNLVYKSQGYDLNGVLFQDDEQLLGFSNIFEAGASPSQEWRGNATVRWANDMHNVSLRMNHIGGMTDNRPTTFYTRRADGTISDYGRFAEDYVDFDLTYIYTAPFWEELDLRFSVLNITDEDPMAFQTSGGYYAGVGNPRGRQFEVAATKKF